MAEESSPYATLAEILTSKRVGLLHVRLVGDVIVAQSRLNERLGQIGKGHLPPDQWSSIIERTLECEDRYKESWQKVNASADPLDSAALRDLADALREAAVTFDTLRTALDD